jgi:hypothetical protein
MPPCHITNHRKTTFPSAFEKKTAPPTDAHARARLSGNGNRKNPLRLKNSAITNINPEKNIRRKNGPAYFMR